MRLTAPAFCLLQASGALAAYAFQPNFPAPLQNILEAAISNAKSVIAKGNAQMKSATVDPTVGAVLDESAPPPPGSNQMAVRSFLGARYDNALAWYNGNDKSIIFTHEPQKGPNGELRFPFMNRVTGKVVWQDVGIIPDGINAITVHADPEHNAQDQVHVHILNPAVYRNVDGSSEDGEDYRRPSDISEKGLRTNLWEKMSSINGIFRLIEHESFHFEVDPKTGYQLLDDGTKIPGLEHSIYNLAEIQRNAKKSVMSLKVADTPAIVARFCSVLEVKGVKVNYRANGNTPTATFNQVKADDAFSGCRKRDGSCSVIIAPGEPEEDPTNKPTTEDPGKPTNENPTKPTTEEPTEPNQEPTDPNQEPTEPTSQEPTEPSSQEPTDPSSQEPTDPNKPKPNKPNKPQPVARPPKN